jgi:LysR family glycine cleavage system transcriptional activator
MPLTRIPSLNWLRVFETAARHESFARAAEALNMSPPAVSQQIRALEGYLKRDLFERGSHSVRLSDAGRAFLPVVVQALHSIETTADSIFGDPRGQPLVVQCSLMMACGWLAPRLPRFQAAHPEVRFSLLSGIYDEEFLRSGADLKITFGIPPGQGEEGDPLFGETLYPVAVPAIAETIRNAEDLADHQLYEIATHRANWFQLLPHAGVDAEAELRLCYADTTQLAFAMAAAGGGIALARAPATNMLEQTHGLVPCLPGLSIPGSQSYSLVYPARAGLSRAAQAFRTWLLAEIAAQE